MNKIQKISSHMLTMLHSLIIATPAYLGIQWILIDIPPQSEFFEKKIWVLNKALKASEITWAPCLKILGFFSEFIHFLGFFIGLFILRALFREYQKGHVLTFFNAQKYNQLGWLALLHAFLFKPLSGLLLVLAFTWNNPPGHRYITLEFGTLNFISVFQGIMLIVISWVLLEASRIKDEQKLTI